MSRAGWFAGGFACGALVIALVSAAGAVRAAVDLWHDVQAD